MAVRPSVQGHKIGEMMIDWAKDFARSRSRQYLRLDCLAGNLALRQYYEGLGFRFRRQATYLDYTGALYEMRL